MSDTPNDPGSAPADEAPAGTPSTAENVCPTCGGSGRAGEGECPDCDPTGSVTEAVGGG